MSFACGVQAQWFEEVAADAGIDFVHAPAKTSRKYLVEAMGSGVAILDGGASIFFVNGAALDDPVAGGGQPDKSDRRYWNRLYRATGEWQFSDETESARAHGRGYGMGVAVADYDGDGDDDIYVTNFGGNELLRREADGTYTDVTARAGVAGSGWSAGAAFFDFDGDGWLDLFVSRYLDWSFDKDRPCGPFLPERRSYCHPRRFGAISHLLFVSNGDGTFRDVSDAVGLSDAAGKGLGVALGDYDHDGWVDVFVANDSYPQQLFRNVAGERLQDVAVEAGVAYDAEGNTYAGMGVSWEDYDADGWGDIVVNGLGRQGYWLYRNVEGEFEVVSAQAGLRGPSTLRSGWGMGLVDFDGDGWRDLFVAQGHVMDDIAESDPALSPEEPLMLLRGLFGRFFDVSSRGGGVFRERFAGRGAAFGDLDGDGDLDVVVNQNGGRALVLRNVAEVGERVAVAAAGSGGNREGIGTRVEVEVAPGRNASMMLHRAGSYLSSSPIPRSVATTPQDR